MILNLNMHSFAPQTTSQTHFFNNCHLSLSRVDTSLQPLQLVWPLNVIVWLLSGSCSGAGESHCLFRGSCLKISLEWVALLPYAPEETASHSTNSIQKLQEEKLERYEQRFRTSYEKWKSLIKEGKRLLAEFSSNDLLQDVMTRVSCWFCL